MGIFKILLIGFSEREAKAINLLVELSLPKVKLLTITREYGKDFKPVLPDLSPIKQDYDGLILDLDGLGLTAEETDYRTKITNFTQGMPMLGIFHAFTEENASSSSTSHAISSIPNCQTLIAPYDRLTMLVSLRKFIALVQSYKESSLEKPFEPLHHTTFLTPTAPTESVPTKAPAPALEASSTPESPTTATTISPTQQNISTSESDSQPIDRIIELLLVTFPNMENSYFCDFATALHKVEHCSVLQIGESKLYVNPFDRSTVINDFAQLLENIKVEITKPHKFYQLFFEPLPAETYEIETVAILAQGGERMPISRVIWRIGLQTLPEDKYTQSHNLPIKINYMPNLAAIDNAPEYVSQILASCLIKVRHLNELQALLPNQSIGEINCIIILMMISEIIDTRVLFAPPSTTPSLGSINTSEDNTISDPQSSYDTSGTTDNFSAENANEPVQLNETVQRAQKSGFFKRLLGKLSF